MVSLGTPSNPLASTVLAWWRPLRLTVLAATLIVNACTDDVAVVGQKCDGACPDIGAEVDGGEVGNQDVPPVAPTVNFYLETKTGNALEGTVNTANLDTKNDLAPEIGIQVNVVVQTTNAPDGASVVLSVGGQAVGQPSVISKGAARFDKVTVPCAAAPSTLGVVVTVAPGAVGQASKTVQVQCGNACSAALVAAPACLTDDADPQTDGFQYTFTVKTDTADCTHAYLKVTDAEGNSVTSAEVALAGSQSVPVQVKLSSKSKGLTGASAKVTAVVKDAGGNRPEGESPVQVVTLTTESPVVTITAPLPGQLTLTDDTDPVAAGVQVLISGKATTLTPADIGAVEVAMEGTATVTTTVQADGSFAVPWSFPESKAYALKITAKNSCGLSGSASAVYTVFANVAGLAITDPVVNGTWLAKDDGNAATALVYEAKVTVAINGGTADSDIAVYCRKNVLGAPLGQQPVGTANYKVGATLLVPVAIDAQVYGNKVACIATDNAPNAAVSAEVPFVVALPAPCIKVQSPADKAKTNSTTLALVASAANLQGAAVTLSLKSASGVVFDPIAVGTATDSGVANSVNLQPAGQKLLDGEYTFNLDAIDGFGNHAAASLCSDATRTLTLDTTGPTATISLPSKATLTTLDDPDSAPATPGYQVDVQVDIADAVKVCLQSSSGQKDCKLTTAADKKVVFAAVTLQPGLNTVQVTADDEVGNQTVAAPWVGTLVSAAPIVQFTSPPSTAISTVADVFKFVAQVTNVGGAPVKGATTEVLVDGATQAVTVTETAPGIYEFTVTGLSGKPITKVLFAAKAVGAGDKDKGFSPEVTVTFKSTKPSVAITAPLDKAVFNATSAQCLAGAQDCVTDVVATVTDVEDGAGAELTVTCGVDPPKQATASVLGGKATFTAVALKDQSACKLAAKATDAALQVALSQEITVTVDRVAPKFLPLASPAKADLQFTLVAVEDIDKFTDGMQIVLTVAVKGAQAGQTVTLDLDQLGAKSTLQAKIGAVTNDTGKADFGKVDLKDSVDTKLVFTVTDLAGNVATVTYAIQVQSKQASIGITGPSNVSEGPCTSHANCGANLCISGTCAVPWGKAANRTVTASTTGFPAGSKMVLCASGSGASGPDCATSGYKQIDAGTLPVSLTMQFNAATLGDGKFVLVVEGSFPPDIPVTSSTGATALSVKQRTVFVDTVAPTIAAATEPAAPGAKAACLNVLSQSKDDLGAPGGTFAFSVTGSEEGQITVVGGGAFATTAATAGKSASAVLALSTEGTLTVAVTAADLVGNTSTVLNLGPFVVDTLKPTGAFAQPSSSKVIVGQSLDVVVVSQSADAEGQDVTLKDGATTKGTEKLTAGTTTFTDAKYKTLVDGDHSLQADVRDLCGNVATVATNPAKVTVDTIPPTVSFTTPAQGATFGDTQDAESSAGGYQVAWAVSVGDTASYKIEIGEGCDAAFANCTAFKQVAAATAVASTISSGPGSHITIPFGASPNYSVRATVTDANGNTATASRGFKVQLSGCLVSLKGLPAGGTFNNASCATANKDCASLSATVTADLLGPCGTIANIQLKKGSTEVGKKPPTGTAATFALTVTDGDNTTLEAIALDGSGAVKGTSGPLALKADLSAPKVAFVAGTVLGVPTSAGPGPVLVGKLKDLNGQAGHQLHLQVQATDTGLGGGKLTKLERTVGATTVALAVSQPNALPVVLSANPATIDLQFATLQEDAGNTVTATVTDAAGNVGTGQIVVTVDWVAPAAPVLAALQAADLNARRPMAKLSLTAVGDNGATGKADKYLVRYSKVAMDKQADFDAACDAAKLPAATIPSPAAAGTAQQIFVEGPDPRPNSYANPDPCKFVPLTDNGASSWHFAVQAQDAAGNLSPVSNSVSTTGLALRYAKINLGGTFNKADMRSRVQKVGDLNGDGLGDVALGGGAAEPLCIVYGRNQATVTDIDLSVSSAYPSHVCLTNPGGLGAPVSSGGDVNGDGVDDLVAAVGTGTSVLRSVVVYLGKKGAAMTDTPAVTVKDIAGGFPYGVWKAQIIGNFNGDAANGKPLADIAITTKPTSKYAYDRVLVLPGNAAWNSASPKTISIDADADRAANNMATIRLVDQNIASPWGNSMLGVGNMLADSGPTQYDDLFTSLHSGGQSAYVVKGRPLSGDVQILLSYAGNQTGDATAVAIRGTSATGSNQIGSYQSVIKMDNDGIPDLALQHQSSAGIGGLYWVRGSYLASKLGTNFTLTPGALLTGTTDTYSAEGGYVVRQWHWVPMQAGNFADRQGSSGPFIDVVHGIPTFTGAGGTNRVVIRLGMVRPASAIPAEVSLQYEDFWIEDPFNKGKLNWGTSTNTGWGGTAYAPVGDFNGDGQVDLVIGSLDGSLVVVY